MFLKPHISVPHVKKEAECIHVCLLKTKKTTLKFILPRRFNLFACFVSAISCHDLKKRNKRLTKSIEIYIGSVMS